MSWVAKCSYNGIILSKEYDSIYACQNYIDSELKIMEYFYRRIIVLENHLTDKASFDNEMDVKYPNGCSFGTYFFELFNSIFQSFSNKFKDDIQNITDSVLLGKEIKDIASDDYTSNNVIRCYNTTQNRFATGFDF